MQYSQANSSEERRNLYSVLFDYVLHQINETCIATGVNEYSDAEIQPLAALLAQTNAPEAFYISVKLGVEGIGEILRSSIASALSRYPNSKRLNMVHHCYFPFLVGNLVLGEQYFSMNFYLNEPLPLLPLSWLVLVMLNGWMV